MINNKLISLACLINSKTFHKYKIFLEIIQWKAKVTVNLMKHQRF